MADGGNPTFEIIIQKLDQIATVQQGLAQAAKDANTLEGNISGVAASLRESVQEIRYFREEFAKVLGDVSLNSALSNKRSGGIVAALKISENKGAISQLQADAALLGIKYTDAFEAGIKKRAAAFDKELLTPFYSTQQSTPSNSLSTLDKQIIGTKARLTDLQEQLSVLSGQEREAFVAGPFAQENAVLANLIEKQNQLKQAEAARMAVLKETDDLIKKMAGDQSAADAAAIKAAKEKLAIQAEANRTAAKQQADANKQFSQYLKPAAKTPLTPSESIDNRLADPNYLTSLFKIQAALLGNYLLMTQIFKLFSFGAGFVKDFDATLVAMQAIGSFTNTQMKDLKDTIVDIGDASKFTTVEIAKAGEEMAKAGFNAEQIKTSLKAVTQLAAATGVPLVDATKDVVTVIDTFKMSADETTHITNALAGALNSTKLEAEGLSSGLAQSGNIAQEAGVSFEELTAVMAALANAGVKSQIIGSGLRTVITSLENPNAKLLKQLHEVGLTSDDVNIKTHGLIGALQNLTKAGFGSEGAFAAFNARGASAFLAIQNNIGTAGDLEKQIIAGSAAAKASDTQMKSLASSATALENSLGALIDKGFTPIKDILIDAAGAGATFLDFLNKSTAVVPILAEILGSTVAVFSTAFVGKQVLNIGKGLVGLIDFGGMAAGAKLVTASVTELGAAIFGAETAAVGLSGAFAGAAAVATSVTLPGWVAWGAIIATVAFGLDHLHRASSDAETATENLNTKMNTQKDALVKANEQIQSYGNEITNLQTKYGYLSSHHDALETELERLKQRFPQLGDAVLSAVDPVNKLIDRLKELQKQSEASKFSALEAILDASKQQEKSALFDLSDQMRKVKPNTTVDKILGSPSYNSNSIIDRSIARGAGIFDTFKNDLSGVAPAPAGVINSIRNQISSDLADQVKFLSLIPKGDPGSPDAAAYNNQLFGNPDKPSARSVKGDIVSLQKQVDDQLFAIQKQVASAADDVQKTNIEKTGGKEQLEKLRDQLKGFQDNLGNLPVIAAGQVSAMNQLIETGAHNVNTRILGSLSDQLMTLPGQITGADDAFNKADKNHDLPGKEAALKSIIDYKRSLDNLLYDLTSKDTSGLLQAILASEIAKNDGIDQKLAAEKVKQLTAAAQSATAEAADKIAKNADNLMQNIAQLMKQTNDALEKLNQKLETDQLYNNQQIAEIDASIAANADHNSPNFGKLTGGTIATLEASKRELGLDNLRIEKASLTQQLGDISSGESNAIRARDNLSGYASASPDSEEYKAYEKAQADVIKLEKDRITTVAKLNQVTATLDYQTGSLTAKNESYADTVQHAITFSNQQAMATNDLGTALRDNVIKTMDTARTSFAGFLKDWLTGTKSMGDAAKQLGKTILEEILNKMTMSASTNLIDMGSRLGGGALSSGLGWLLGGGLLPHFNTGGMPYKRAATGMSTRDSVPILARPGEYILRESAVGMIGKDNLDYINAMGNSRLSQSQSNMRMPAPQKTELNVYVVSPQAQPTLTKNDVIATITDDMARGGATKKLVKSISVGAM